VATGGLTQPGYGLQASGRRPQRRLCKCSISSIPSRAGGKPDNGEPAHKKFKLLTIFDFLDQPELKPLVEDVLPAPGEVHLLFGESNAYKSFLALDLLCSVAHNIPWHGRTVDPGPVIYVVTEGVGAAARQRLRAWLEQHEIPREQWGIVRIIDVPVPLNVVAIVDQLICTIHEDLPSAKLVVFDLLAGSMEGSDGDGDIAGQWVKGTHRLSQATSITQLHVTHSALAKT
jgi:RecA-family ATPase